MLLHTCVSLKDMTDQRTWAACREGPATTKQVLKDGDCSGALDILPAPGKLKGQHGVRQRRGRVLPEMWEMMMLCMSSCHNGDHTHRQSPPTYLDTGSLAAPPAIPSNSGVARLTRASCGMPAPATTTRGAV